MEYDPKDNEVIHLLKKLKDSNGAYPPEMLALRRAGYLKQVAEISAGAGLAMGLKNMAKGGKGAAGFSSTAGTIVEALLVVALVAEAGAVTYFYRDKVAEYVNLIARSPKVEEVASPPVVPSPILEMQVTPSPIDTITATLTKTETLTPATPSGTPSPVLVSGTTVSAGENSAGIQSASTSGPGGSSSSSSSSSSNSAGDTSGNTGGSSGSSQDPKGNNGNHYGQTPKPERTKEPGNNTSSTQESTSKNNKKP
jgi:hypothetical protein